VTVSEGLQKDLNRTRPCQSIITTSASALLPSVPTPTISQSNATILFSSPCSSTSGGGNGPRRVANAACFRLDSASIVEVAGLVTSNEGAPTSAVTSDEGKVRPLSSICVSRLENALLLKLSQLEVCEEEITDPELFAIRAPGNTSAEITDDEEDNTASSLVRLPIRSCIFLRTDSNQIFFFN
jgi:hypothetical protein